MAGEIAENCSLTRAERALLAILTNPEYFKADDKAKYTAAGISESRYYQLMRKPEFKQALVDMFRDMLQGDIGPIIAAAKTTATTCLDRDGHQDRKMLLEMAGVYTPKQEVKNEHSGANGGPIVIEIVDDERA